MIIDMPYNLAAHHHLRAMGYKHTHYNSDFEDIGDAENGPCLTGSYGFDEYAKEDHYIVIDEEGRAFYETEIMEFPDFLFSNGRPML
jgi:hypothetical protein